MGGVFYIVGPTANGKSDIAAEVAARCNAEIIGADAFQLYRGIGRLTAQPDVTTLARVRHHLIGTVPLTEEMSAERYREMARAAIGDIHARGRNVIVVGGSGLYVRALAEGFSRLPPPDPALREWLEHFSLRELNVRLRQLDPASAERVDANNRRRVVRALEICMQTGAPVPRDAEESGAAPPAGVFLTRDREDLYARVNERAERMLADGVIDEVRAISAVGQTAAQAIGFREIKRVIDGEMSRAECVAALQQATRRYAKRQLTWFRRQSSFEVLNLTPRTSAEAIEWIAQKARLSFAQ